MGKTRTAQTKVITLDTGALIALERGDGRMIALLEEAEKRAVRFYVPSGVVGQAWRNGQTQAKLARFLRNIAVYVVPLDESVARRCGELCGAKGTSDIIDASVVIVARQTNSSRILSSDTKDLKRLDPKADVEHI